jgi:hypothetical protein
MEIPRRDSNCSSIYKSNIFLFTTVKCSLIKVVTKFQENFQFRDFCLSVIIFNFVWIYALDSNKKWWILIINCKTKLSLCRRKKSNNLNHILRSVFIFISFVYVFLQMVLCHNILFYFLNFFY